MTIPKLGLLVLMIIVFVVIKILLKKVSIKKEKRIINIIGTIILVIGIIGSFVLVGFLCLQQWGGGMQEFKPNSYMVAFYNSEWFSYIGNNKRGEEIIQLINKVKAFNMNQDIVREYGEITLKRITSASDVDKRKFYTVRVEYDEYSGLVNAITITPE